MSFAMYRNSIKELQVDYIGYLLYGLRAIDRMKTAMPVRISLAGIA